MKHWIPLLALANNKPRSSSGEVDQADFNKLKKELMDLKKSMQRGNNTQSKSSSSKQHALGNIVGHQQVAHQGAPGSGKSKKSKKAKAK